MLSNYMNIMQFNFSKTSYKEYSDFEFNIVDGGSTWYLHKCILQEMCPRILTIDKERLKSFNLPENTYEALITFIYQDKLLNMDFLEMIDFHMLLVLCEMQELASYIISKIMVSCPKETANNIALAFSKLMKYPEFNTTLFDSLYSFFSQQTSRDDAVISSIMQGPEHFIKLALHRILLSEPNKNTDEPSNPCGKLHKVVRELFPQEFFHQVTQKTPSSNDNKPDFTIKCQGRIFPCHKLLLVLRWPYFEKVMSFNGLETTKNTLEIPADTLTPESTERLLKYLYTNDRLGITSVSIAHNILTHAKYFEMLDAKNVAQSPMEPLISHCRRIVFNSLKEVNCVTILNRALEYGTDYDVKRARKFIVEILHSGKLASIKWQLKHLSPEECYRLLTLELK